MFPVEQRGSGAYKIEGRRFCFHCTAALYPERVRSQVRREQLILAELQRQLPEIVEHAQTITWDCRVPGGCSLKRPDLLYVYEDCYLQVEVDEYGHPDKGCADEDVRLELIAADVGLPGLVVRINPDSLPLMYRRRRQDGEIVWLPCREFLPAMQRLADFIADKLPDVSEGISRYFFDGAFFMEERR
jgi:hypothetical protein